MELCCSSNILGYMDIYRRKKSVRGATRGPRGWGAPRGVGRVGECSNFKKNPTHTQDHGDA